jgi:transposase
MLRIDQVLLTRWVHLNTNKKRQLNARFALNRRVMKAYLLKESLDRLWNYTYEGAMLRYLQSWIDQLCWQRLKPMEKLARMLLNHLEELLNYCRIKVPLGVVEAVNGNIKALLRRGRGYRDLDYLPLAVVAALLNRFFRSWLWLRLRFSPRMNPFLRSICPLTTRYSPLSRVSSASPQ